MFETPHIQLHHFISFEGFDYNQYRRHELEILEPRLRAIGYHDIQWGKGESDSFGPLTRTCTAKDQYDNVVHFMYG